MLMQNMDYWEISLENPVQKLITTYYLLKFIRTYQGKLQDVVLKVKDRAYS